MPVTFRFQPAFDVQTVDHLEVFRKADVDTPGDSYLVEDWGDALDAAVSAGSTSFTDSDGNDDYLYMVMTVGSDGHKVVGPPIPGHGRSSYCRLIAGQGWLSNFAPNAITATELYHEEHEATLYVMDEYLRPRYEMVTILPYYLDPPPKVRDITALWACISLVGKHRPQDEEQLREMRTRFSDLAGSFAASRLLMNKELEEKHNDRSDVASLGLTWDR